MSTDPKPVDDLISSTGKKNKKGNPKPKKEGQVSNGNGDESGSTTPETYGAGAVVNEANGESAESPPEDQQYLRAGAAPVLDPVPDEDDNVPRNEVGTRALPAVMHRPELFWWSEPQPGHHFLAALMKIGLVYATARMVKKIHVILSNTAVIKIFYLSWLSFLLAIHRGLMTGIFVAYDILVNVLKEVAPKVFYMYLVEWARYLRFGFYMVDRRMANYVIDLIYLHPWLHETPMELLDDLIHYFLSHVCVAVHPESNNPRCKDIEEAIAARQVRVQN